MKDSQKTLKITSEEVKGFFGSLRSFFVQYYKDFFEGVKTLDKKDLSVKLFSVLGISIALAFFCYLREGTGDLYMSVFIPAFFANAFIVFFGCANKSSKIYSLLTVFLITTGFALQIFMLDPENAESASTVYNYVTFVFVGIVLSMLVMPVLAFITSENADTKVLRYLIIGAIVLAYLVLLVFAKDINGAKSWIFIGSTSIQVTEITKILAGIYFALCLTDTNLSEKAKGIRTFVVLLVHAAFLGVIGEFGTLGMIAIVFFVLKLLFVKNKKQLFSEFIALVLMFLVVLGISFALYTSSKEEQAPEQVVETVTEEAVEAADVTEDDEKVGIGAIVDKLLEEIAEIYPKFDQRVSVFLGKGELSESDTYQIDSAKKALWYVEWFGTEEGSFGFVPEIKSDFVFIYLVVRWGIVGALMVLIALVFLFAETFIFAARSKKPRESVLAICFICFIVIQSLLCVAANLGLFPVVGLPFAYLSDGGSAMCVNLMMAFFNMYFMRKERPLPIESEATDNV